MANPDITISYGGDDKSRNILRKEILKSLKDLSIGISSSSITEGKKKIQGAFEKSPPKISIDVNMSSLRSAKSKIQAGLSDVAIKLKINPSDIRAEKNKIQALLGNFSIGFQDPKLLQNLQKTIKGISDVKFTLNKQSLNNFLSQAQAALNRNPLQVNVVIPAKTSNLLNTASKQTTKQSKQQTNQSSSRGSNKQQIDELTTFGERIGFTTSRLVAYTIAAGALYRTIQGVRSAADSIKDIDTAINRLTQILDGNVQRASSLASSVIDIAEKFGQSGKQILGIADELAQTGGVFNTDQAILSAVGAIARTPLLATFTNIEETVNGTIAALNQFNLKAEDTVRIIDIANQVSKKFAFQSQDLFTAVSRGGSSFRLAGGEIEDFTAFVAAAKELTLLPATTIGTGINTISLKLLQTENINFLDDLTNGKIRDAEGNLKGVNDILIETGRALRGLSKQETAGIFTQLFDVRQTKIGGPLLQNIRDSANGESVLEKVKKETSEGIGSSARDAAFGVERIDAILGSVTARFDKVFKSFAEDQGIKNLVKDFASLAKSFADTVGALQPIIPSLIRAGAAFAAVSVVRNIPGFLRGSENVKPGPFNPLSPSSVTSRSNTGSRSTTSSARASQRSSFSDVITGSRNNSAFASSLRSQFIGNTRNAIRSNEQKIKAGDLLQQMQLTKKQVLRDVITQQKNGIITPQQFINSGRSLINSRSNASSGLLQASSEKQVLSNQLNNLNKINRSLLTENSRIARGKETAPTFNKILNSANQQFNVASTNPRALNRLAFANVLREVKNDPRNAKLNSAQLNRVATTQFNNLPRGQGSQAIKTRAFDESLLQARSRLIADNNSAIFTNTQKYAQAQKQLAVNAIKQARYNNVIAQTTAAIAKLKSQFASSQKTQRSLDANTKELSRLQALRSSALDKLSRIPGQVGPIRSTFNAVGAQFGAVATGVKNGINQNAQLIAGLGIATLSNSIIDVFRNNLDQPSGFFNSEGSLSEDFVKRLDKNDSINKQQSVLSSAANFASLGSILGAAIGTAIAPGIGTALGASLGGAAIGAASGVGIGLLSAKDNTQSELLGLIGQTKNDQDKQKIISEFLNRSQINDRTETKAGVSLLSRGGLTPQPASVSTFIEDKEGREKFKENITSSGGQDFRDFVFGKISKEFINDKNTELLDIDIVQKSLTELGLSAEQSKIFINAFSSNISELSKSSRDLVKTFDAGILDFKNNFADFVSNFNKSSQNSLDSLSIFQSNISRREGAFNLASGGSISADLIPNNFAEILVRQLGEKLNTTNVNDVASTTKNALSSVLSGSESKTIGDFLTVRKLVFDSTKQIRGGLSGIEDNANEAVVSTKIEEIIKKVFPDDITQRFSRIPEGREFFANIRTSLNALAKDPNINQKSQDDISNAVLGEFSNLAFIVNRVNATIEQENLVRQEAILSYEKEAKVFASRFAIEQNATNFNVGNLSRRKALGETSSASVAFLRSLLKNTNLDGASSNLGNSNIALGSAQRSFNINTLDKDSAILKNNLNNASINNKIDSDIFQEELQKSSSNLQILNSIFDELTNSIKNTIEANKKIGLTDVSERITGERDLSIVQQQIGGLFGPGGLLSNVTNPESLVKTFGNKLPEIATSINKQFGNNSMFLRAAQGATSLFGGTTLSGGSGQTVEEAVGLIGALSGFGRIDPKSGKQLELEKLLSLGQDQLKVFFDARTIEQKQLDALTNINTTLIAGFNLPITPTSAPQIERPAVPQVPQPTQPKNETSFDKSRVDKLIEGTAEILSFTKTLKDKSPESKESIDSLRDVLKEVLADAGSAKRGKNESKIDFKSDINIQGFENIGKDQATALITISILNKFVEKLQGGTPSELDLANKLLLAIKEIQNGMKNK